MATQVVARVNILVSRFRCLAGHKKTIMVITCHAVLICITGRLPVASPSPTGFLLLASYHSKQSYLLNLTRSIILQHFAAEINKSPS
jgi:hypothetical protein